MEKPEVAAVTAAMRRKTTDALLEIWRENDRQTWSDAALAAVRQVLEERGVDLPDQGVEAPADPAGAEGDHSMVVVDTFMLAVDGEMARLRLEAEDIPCIVSTASVGATAGVSGGAAMARLLVRRSDAARALQILQADRSSRPGAAESDADSGPSPEGTEPEAPPPPSAPEGEPDAAPPRARRRRWWPW